MGGAGSWELAARGVSKAVGGRALRLPIVRNALGQIDSWALFKHSELSTPQWPLENAGVCVCVLSRLTLCDPAGCIAHQAPLSMGFSRQESWSELPCLLQGIFSAQESNLHPLHLLYWQGDPLPLSHLGGPKLLQESEQQACRQGKQKPPFVHELTRV